MVKPPYASFLSSASIAIGQAAAPTAAAPAPRNCRRVIPTNRSSCMACAPSFPFALWEPSSLSPLGRGPLLTPSPLWGEGPGEGRVLRHSRLFTDLLA